MNPHRNANAFQDEEPASVRKKALAATPVAQTYDNQIAELKRHVRICEQVAWFDTDRRARAEELAAKVRKQIERLERERLGRGEERGR